MTFTLRQIRIRVTVYVSDSTYSCQDMVMLKSFGYLCTFPELTHSPNTSKLSLCYVQLQECNLQGSWGQLPL